MKKSAYDTLGVPKDADAATVRRAYRKKAKAAHPDSPTGSEDAFKELNRAHALLADPAKRADYDRFGDKADSVKTLRTQAEETLANMACQCVAARNPEVEDIWQLLVDAVGQNKLQVQRAVPEAEREAAKFRKAAKRWKKKGGGESPIVRSLEASAAASDENVKAMKFEVEKLQAMLECLYEHSYESPSKQKSPYDDMLARVTFTPMWPQP